MLNVLKIFKVIKKKVILKKYVALHLSELVPVNFGVKTLRERMNLYVSFAVAMRRIGLCCSSHWCCKTVLEISTLTAPYVSYSI